MVLLSFCLSKRFVAAYTDPEDGGTGGLDPPGKYKIIGCLINTGPDPLKNTKLPIQHSILGHHRPANSGIWMLPPLIKLKKKASSKLEPL